MDEAVLKLIDLLSTIAPEGWQMLLKQVYVEAIAKILWAIPLAIFSYVFYKMSKNDGELLYSLVSTLFGAISFGLTISAIMWMVNPEFYAIRFLLKKLTGQ